VIDVTKFTVSNGTDSFTLTNRTANVNPSSATQATIVVEGKDKAYLNWILNNNGLTSKSGVPFNLAVQENWNGLSFEDNTTPVSIYNYEVPTIVSATYNRLTSELRITATRLAAATGIKDIDATRFTITGKDGENFTLTASTQDVDVLSETLFNIYIGEGDKAIVDQLIDIEGTSASSGHQYNLAATDRWNRPVHEDYNIADPGNPIEALDIPNNPPVASDVVIAGSLEIGSTVTGTYTYTDLESDQQGESIFTWYRADDASGTGETVIEGEDGISYTITLEDAGKYLAFEVTPVAETGITTGSTVKSPYTQVANSPPSAVNAEISGVFDVCRELTASYEYSDPENDPEGGTVIKWFRSDNASGNNLLEIHQGNNYTPTLEDEGKFISIEVTPAAESGASPGEPVRSDFYGPVVNNLPTASISGPSEFCMGSSIVLVFNLTGAAPWTVEYTDGQNDFSFTTSESSYELTVSAGGVYQVTSVTDSHGCEGTETGSGHTVNVAATIAIADWYIETFQDASSQWVSEGDAVNSWTYGLPDGNIFTSASAGGNIWYTDILNPDASESSRVISPCFDFTDVERPMIAIDLWSEFAEQSDGAVLQYSLDNSDVWVNIGNPGQGINWYNSAEIAGNPGGQSVGWTGNGNGSWSESRHDLEMLAGENQVRLRIAYGSDGSGQTRGGVAFDNIRIGERSRRVLVEHFTNARQEESIEANNILHAIALERKSDIAYISYHTPFPQSDPINEQNSADPAARALFYGVASAPVSILDGGLDGEGRFDYSSSVISEDDLLRRALVDPEFKIEISQTQTDDNLNIEIQVGSLFNFGPRDLTLHVAILETEILASQLGLQGDQVYRNVVRKLQPDAGGTFLPVSWSAGETQTYSFDWTITNVFDTEKLAVVAFIQDEVSAEIYQVGTSYEFGIPTFVDLPDHVITQQRIAYYPNPASDYVFIEFLDNIQGDHILEVFNMSGTMVKSEILKAGRSVYQIDTSTLNRGVYIFRIKNNSGTEDTTRIMIMK
jgi:hypothetical protein